MTIATSKPMAELPRLDRVIRLAVYGLLILSLVFASKRGPAMVLAARSRLCGNPGRQTRSARISVRPRPLRQAA